MKAEHYIPFQLQVLTPVHIGSGDIFNPLSYIVRKMEGDNYELWLINGDAWIASHAGEMPVAKALNNGELETLRSLLSSAKDISKFLQARIPISSPALGERLRVNGINKKGEVQAFIRNPFTRQPYVPASSLKGAISTALGFYIDQKRAALGLQRICKNVDDPKNIEEQKSAIESVFGSIDSHAMRAMRIADIALGPNLTSINSAIGKDKEPSKPLEKTPCESLKPQDSEFITGLIRLFSTQGKACIHIKEPAENIDIPKLWQICNDFYKTRFEEEFSKFYRLPHFQDTASQLQEIRKRLNKLSENEMLLRIGRYSHIECVTISGIPKGKKVWGISRTLADSILPFGWVILRRCSMADYNKGQAYINASFIQESKKALDIALYSRELREENAKKVRDAQEAALRREKMRIEAEKKAQEEAEAKKKREEILSTLCDEERAIVELGEEGADESRAAAIYNKLDDFGEWKIKAAEALKAYWLRINKWEGRDLAPKQKEKVAKVKEILGIAAPQNTQAPTKPKNKDKKKKKK